MSVPKKGDTVAIFNWTYGGEAVVEGVAMIRRLHGPDHFSGHPLASVEFEDEPGELYRRTIWPHKEGFEAAMQARAAGEKLRTARIRRRLASSGLY